MISDVIPLEKLTQNIHNSLVLGVINPKLTQNIRNSWVLRSNFPCSFMHLYDRIENVIENCI